MGEKCEILFVEDDNNTRMFMGLFLQNFAKKVYTAVDGVDGLNQYKLYKPNIVITDIAMPNMDGIEMAKEIKKINPSQIIIAISAFDEDDEVLKNKEINYFLSKPIEIDELKNKLEEITKII